MNVTEEVPADDWGVPPNRPVALMAGTISMGARGARFYRRWLSATVSGRKEKGRILDALCRTTGWHRNMRSGHCGGVSSIRKLRPKPRVSASAAAAQLAKLRRVSLAPSRIGRRWRETGCGEVISAVLFARRYGFDVERTIYLTVLHRLMVSARTVAAAGTTACAFPAPKS